MLFSIVVPVYNVEKYLEECLKSIICQIDDNENYEIILVDDGSTDKSGVICDEYKRAYPDLIKVFHNTNHDLLLTRRYGYKHAAGEYIVNCDSDDKLEKDMFVRLKEAIGKYDAPDMILFNYYSFTENTKEKGYTDIFTKEGFCRVNKEDVLKEFLLRHSVVSMWGKAYRRTCIDVDRDYTDFAKVSNGEDTLQSIELFNNANTFVYLNQALYDYRMGSGMTRKFDPNYYFGFKVVLEIIEQQKEVWNLPEFEQLFAVKVLQTAGRAITQSRYKKWKSMREQEEYLKQIRKDKMFQDNIKYMNEVRGKLQKSHYMLLKLLRCDMYKMMALLLNAKNITSNHSTEVGV